MQATEPSPPRARAPRAVGWLALAGVSLIAGIASYFHALAVVQAAGSRPPVAYLVPALADLVILGASADLLAASRASHPRPRLTMVALGTGVVVTLAFNVVASHPHALPSWLVDGWPALAFILALESLSGLVRRGRGDEVSLDIPAGPDTADSCPHTVALGAEDAIRMAWEHARDCLGEPLTFVQLGDRFGVDRRKVSEIVKPKTPEPSLNGAGPGA